MGPQDSTNASTLHVKQVLTAPLSPEWDLGPNYPFW